MKYGITNDEMTQSVAEAVKHVLQHAGESQYDLVTEGKMKELHALMSKGMKDPKKIAKELGLAGTKEVHDAIAQLIKKEVEIISKLDQDVVDLHTVDKVDDPEQKKYTESSEVSEAVDNFFGFPTKDKLVKFQSMAKKLKIKPISNPTVMKRGGNEFHVMGFEGSVRDIEKAMKVANDLYNEAVKIGEELSAKQKKLDINKNGKIDGEDLANLRKKAKKEEVDDNAEDAIKANDAETKKTLPKQTKVESAELEEGRFDKLEKKLGSINPETLGDVMDGKIKLNPAEKKEFDEFMKGVRKMFGESTEVDEKVAPNLTKVVNIRREMVKVQTKIDKAVFDGDAKTVNKLSDELHKLRMKLVNFYNENVDVLEKKNLNENRAVVYNPRMIKAFIKQAEKKFPQYKGEIQQAEDDEIVFPNDPKLIKFFKGAKEVKFVLKDSIEEATELFNKGKISFTRFSMGGRGKLGLQINYGMKYIQVPEKEINTLLTGLNTAFKDFKKNLGESIELEKEIDEGIVDKAKESTTYLEKLINKILEKNSLKEAPKSVQEAIQPGVFIKGGNKKATKDEVEDILGRILFNPRLQKALEKSKPFKQGQESKGKGKNPYKTDTLDFHHFELGAMEGSMG